MQIVEVKAGDTLWALSRRCQTTVEALAFDNQIADPARLTPGQTLIVPGGSGCARRSAEVNAYAYPNIAPAVLEEVLPYLTALCPFSWRFTAGGELIPLADESLIVSAYAADAAPMLTLTNIGEGGGFSSELGHALLTDKAVQDNVLEGVVAAVRERDLYGLNLNFEYLQPFDRDAYSAFVARCAERLHPLGCPVSTAIAPKESAAQEGFLYAAHDYEAHGKYADRVILMTYEWGYTFGAPQAISPVDRIRRVLDYAVTVIPRRKLLLGLSNYAYDWTLPWKQGTAARILSDAAAVELAVSRGAVIRFDETAAAPWFSYTDAEGKAHVVWFEDARSVLARLRLVEDYGLAGVSIWTANQRNRPLFKLLESLYSVEKLF
ncbi:MAG: LysM peptidoglycan-binding domain-containing protein [Oscillospiraceae bacterium]|nr:LysM peptidoglycan-binding domain-containing protein [Oscillospiraceae bacterium]